MKEALAEWLRSKGGEVQETGKMLVFTKILGERRLLFLRQRVVFKARFRLDEEKRELRVHEELWERGAGLARETGAGSQKEVCELGKKREGQISARFSLLSSRFRFEFDHTQFHQELENLAQKFGYTVRYQVVP